jgi:DNA-binding Lrp family transcriptional regulator
MQAAHESLGERALADRFPPGLRLLNEFQHRFPLTHAPYAAVASRLGQTQEWVLETLHDARMRGAVSRVGAVFAPGTIGVSMLGALRVPQPDLERVAHLVSRCSEVNHNYEREDDYNLWFVATAPDDRALEAALRTIEAQADCGRLLELRLIDEYRIDLGFDLGADLSTAGHSTRLQAARMLSAQQRRLAAALQPGLELAAHPYAALAQQAGLDEADCIAQLRTWIEEGTIRRFGVIVRHRELGFRSNAMVVWNVPDALTTAFGLRLAHSAGVTLAYRRARCEPQWAYNLYCMVHGRDRGTVAGRIDALRGECGLLGFPSRTLFSRRCYKQRGARYVEPLEAYDA